MSEATQGRKDYLYTLLIAGVEQASTNEEIQRFLNKYKNLQIAGYDLVESFQGRTRVQLELAKRGAPVRSTPPARPATKSCGDRWT